MNRITFRDWSTREWTRESIKEVIRSVYESMNNPKNATGILRFLMGIGYYVEINYQYVNDYGIYINYNGADDFYKHPCHIDMIDLTTSWYPFFIIPIYNIEMLGVQFLADDLEFESTNYKAVHKTLTLNIINKGDFANYNIPNTIDIECLVLYTNNYTINNNYITPDISGLPSVRIGTVPRLSNGNNFVLTMPCMLTNQIEKGKIIDEVNFSRYNDRYVCPDTINLTYEIENVRRENLTDNYIDYAFFNLYSYNGIYFNYLTIDNVLYDYIYAGNSYPLIGLTNRGFPPYTYQLTYNSNQLTRANPQGLNLNVVYRIEVSTDDFILYCDPLNSSPSTSTSQKDSYYTKGYTWFGSDYLSYRTFFPSVISNNVGITQNATIEMIKTFN